MRHALLFVIKENGLTQEYMNDIYVTIRSSFVKIPIRRECHRFNIICSYYYDSSGGATSHLFFVLTRVLFIKSKNWSEKCFSDSINKYINLKDNMFDY